MMELSPLAWAAIIGLLMIIAFELVRLGKLSGTFSIAGGVSIIGILDYIDTLNIEAFLGEESMALMMLVLGVVKGWARWRTGDIVREAPAVIGTGDGTTRSLGTGDGTA